MRRSTIFLRSQLRRATKNHCARRAIWVLGLAAFLGEAVVSMTGQTVPPTISTPPQSQTVNPGASVTLSVVATGTAPLSYQWRYNLADIPGAVMPSLTLDNVQASIAGSYQVVVSNPAGSVTSSATLVVNSPPLITGQPANQTVYPGVNVTFVVVAIGTPPLQYQWLLNGSAIPGAVKPVLALTDVQPTDSGGYKALVSNVAGSVASAAAILTVAPPATPVPPVVVAQPQSQSVPTGAAVQFCVTTTGNAPITYQWLFNGVPLPAGGNFSGTTSGCLTIPSAQPTNAGSYSVTASNAFGAVTSDVGVLLVQQPGGEVVFSNIALGINTPVFDVDGITRLAGAGYLAQLYAGPTADSLTAVGPAVPFLTGKLAGHWSVLPGIVRNIPTVTPGTLAFVQARVWQSGTGITFEQASAAGSKLGESPVLSVTTGGSGLPPSPPAALTGLQSFTLLPPLSISVQPTPQVVSVGGTVSFTAAATGTGPFSFQWLTNGTPIAGATSATLTLTNVQAFQAGSYTVAVTNAIGASAGATAMLTVLAPPTITTGPMNQTVVQGATAIFSVVAAGSGPLSYQWWFSNSPIPGATTTNLSLNNVTATNAGNYTVTVSNVVGSVTSSNAVLTVNMPVTISQQPQSLTVIQGTNVTFSVIATGTSPLSYQWWFNNSPIPGATTTNLSLNNVTATNAGNYTVTVSNVVGSVTSSNAVLTVNMPVTISQQPQSLTVIQGTNVTFSVIATGTSPLSYQWWFSNSPIPGATSTNLSLNNVAPTNAGNYTVTVSNVVGSVTSSNAVLTVNVPVTISQQPQSLTVIQGTNVTFSVIATGTSPLSYQWWFNNSPIPGATTTNLSLNNVTATNAGNYTVTVSNVVGSVTSSNAVLTVNVPVTISQQPQSLTVIQGTNVTFSVIATGTSPLSYQWWFSNSPIPGATTTNLSLNNVAPTNAGNYTVTVSNVVGSVTSSNAVLTVNVPVTITQQPQSLTVIQGTNVTFSVIATGTSPLSYQWWFNNSPILGATTTNLSLNNVTTTNAGNYTVTVSNVVGSVTSSNAVLTVNVPVTITQQPRSLTVVAGTNATFSVGATGTSPLSYQWWFSNSPILGATTTNLSLNNVTTTNAGNYTVTVSNLVGSVTSSNAVLTVNVPVTITQQPQSLTVIQGTNVTFSVIATGTSPLSYQWWFSNSPIPGATSTNLSLNNVAPTNAGNYTVTVSNVVGSVTSSNAVLTVNAPLRFTGHPGLSNGTFRVTLTGSSGTDVRIEVSTNLVDWLPLTTLTNFSGQSLVTDPQAGKFSRRFYRAVISSHVTAPLQFGGDAVLSNGTLRVTLTGGSATGIRIDFSTNLVNWLPLSTLTNFNGQAVVSDPQAAANPHRFYRTVAP